MAVHCVAAERGGLIKKKRKESSGVKLKARRVGRPKIKEVLQPTLRQYNFGQ